jgi:protein KRI1
MSDSLDLFANAKTDLNSLKVNKNYAERFERNKRREEIQRAKQKAKELGVDFDHLDAEQESESESEDSDGELITKKVNTKFLKALAMIKNRDPRLKDSNFHLFSDSDFETSSEGSGKEKPVYYKDLQRQTILEAAQEEEEEPKSKKSKRDKKGETPVEEQKRLKNEFLSAAKNWESGSMENLLVPRHKTQEEIQQEEDEFQRFVKMRTELEPNTDLNEIKDYWDRVQNEDDRFLKKFVLNQAWQENQELMTYDEIVDQEDEQRDKEIDNFETAFNFRFEEEGFEKIKSKRYRSLFKEYSRISQTQGRY